MGLVFVLIIVYLLQACILALEFCHGGIFLEHEQHCECNWAEHWAQHDGPQYQQRIFEMALRVQCITAVDRKLGMLALGNLLAPLPLAAVVAAEDAKGIGSNEVVLVTLTKSKSGKTIMCMHHMLGILSHGRYYCLESWETTNKQHQQQIKGRCQLFCRTNGRRCWTRTNARNHYSRSLRDWLCIASSNVRTTCRGVGMQTCISLWLHWRMVDKACRLSILCTTLYWYCYMHTIIYYRELWTFLLQF